MSTYKKPPTSKLQKQKKTSVSVVDVKSAVVASASSSPNKSKKRPINPRPIGQSFNSDILHDLKKSLSKKQREISRSVKYSVPDFIEAEPHMLGSLFGQELKVAVNVDSEFVDSLTELTNVIKNKHIHITHDVDVKQQLADLVDRFKKIDINHDVDIKQQLAEVLDKFGSKIGTEEKTIKHTSAADILVDPISNFLKSFSDGIPTPIVIGAIVVAAALVIPKSGTSKYLVIASLGSLLLMYSKKSELVSLFTNFFHTGNSNEASPNFTLNSDFSKLMVVLLNCYLCGSVGKAIFNHKDFSNFFSNLSRNSSGIEYFTSAIVGVFKIIKKSLNKFFNGGNDDTFVMTGEEFIDAYLEECYKLCEDHETGKLVHNASGVDRCSNNIRLGETVFVKIPGHPDFISTRMLVANSIQKVKKIKESLLQTNFKFTGLRVEPTAVFFRGPPGVGKSNAMQHIADAFSALTMDEQDFEDYKKQRSLYIHNRMTETKHWEGYTAKKTIVFYDDLLQARDIQGAPDNEIFSIIRAVNVFEYQLFMAGMDYKGNTMMRANLLVANSNVENYNFCSINDTGAFLRRWDFALDVSPKPQFCVDYTQPLWSRKFDYSKLPVTENGETLFHPDQLEYHVMKVQPDGRGFENAGPVLKWSQVIKAVYQRHNQKLAWHANSCQSLENTLNIYREVHKKKLWHADDGDEEDPPEEASAHAGSSSKDPKVPEDFEEAFTIVPPDTPIGNEIGDYMPFVDSPSDDKGKKPFDSDEADFRSAPYGIKKTPLKTFWASYAEAFDKAEGTEKLPYVPSPGNVELHAYWYNKYPAKFQELKFFYIMLQQVLRVQFRIMIPESMLCRLLKNECDELIARHVDNFDEDELILLVARELSESLSESPQMKDYRKRINQAKADLGRARKTRGLSGWKKMLWETYLWVLGFGIESKRNFEDAIDPELMPFERIFAGMGLFTKIVMAYYFLRFISPWLMKLFPKKTVEADAPVESSYAMLENDNPPVVALEQGKAASNMSRNAQKRASRRGALHASGHSYASESPNVMDIVTSVYRRNCYEWWSPILANRGKAGLPTHEKFGTVLALKMNVLCLPFHFISMVIQYWESTSDDTAFVEIRNVVSKNIVYRTSVKDIYNNIRLSDEGDIRDVGCLWFSGMQPVRDITHLFQTEQELKKYTRPNCLLIIPSKPDGKECHTVVAERMQIPLRVKHKDVDPYSVTTGWQYSSDKASHGDCGAVLYVDDKSRGNIILGFHIAGNADRCLGFSSYLNKEFIDRQMSFFKDKIEVVVPKIVEEPDLKLAQDLEGLRDNMELVGTVDAHMGATTSGFTKIIRSPLCDTYKQSTTAPAKLFKFINEEGTEVSPMKKALDKCCKGKPLLDFERINRAVKNYESKLYRGSSRFVEKRIFTFEEAVVGDGSDTFKAIPRVTSAGFPYVKMKGIRSKERFFGKEEQYRLDSDECNKLKAKCIEIEDKAKRGIRTTHVFIDCLKDERRSLAKVAEGNTRLFSSGPTPLLILMRRYFGSFMKWMNENTISNGCALGVNPYSRDWDSIAQKLNRFGAGLNNVGAGDFKNFDMCGTRALYKAVLDLINRWYGDDKEGNLVRTILFEEVINPLHLNGRRLYYWHSGLSSGILLTTLINNIINQILFRIVFEMMYGAIHDFNNFVELITGGDDNTYSTAPAARLTFTEEMLSSRFAHLGYSFVPEDKSKTDFGNTLRKISEVTFNKREFVYDQHLRRYVGPLDINVVLETPMWLKTGACSVGDLEVKVEQCLDELSLHPEEVFSHWSPRVLDRASYVPGLRRPVEIDYLSVRRKVLERGTCSLPTEVLDLVPEDLDAYAHSWLPTKLNEFHGGKSLGRPECTRERRIYGYCQEALPAVLANSRSHEFSDSLARGQIIISATETNNQTTLTPEPAGNEPASLLPQSRTEPGQDLFFPDSTTKGIDDADIARAIPVNYRPPHAALLNQPKTGVAQEVSDFLKKPVAIKHGVFATTDSVPSNVYSVGIPRGILTSPVWIDKLHGNYAFRGTLCLTLQVNANRFQQGRYILAWVPSGGADVTTNAGIYFFGHTASLCQTTQLPHVEIDISCDTTAYMEIPLINCIGYSTVPQSVAADNYENGTVILRPYSPLSASSGSTTASFTLYAHWKDVEWHMPAVPHSNARVTSRVTRRGNVESVEQMEADIGPVQGALMKVNAAAGMLTAVPFISSVAGPVAWASAIGAKIASAFGWSKPHNSEHAKKMNRYIMSGYNNSDYPDNSTKLAALDKARLEEVVGFGGTDLDELSISYLVTIPAWTQTIPWTTGRGEGDVLSQLLTSPRDHVVSSAYGVNTVTFPTPVAWVSNFFSLWRGSLKFTFKIVKTEFHSGRLLAAFLPYDAGTFAVPAIPSIDDTVYLHREIIDVRYGNEFSIIVPFISLTSYHQIFGADRMTGVLILYVLNPLVAPATVSDTVQILLEVSGGSDMEFAEPRDLLEMPVMVATAHSGNTCEVIRADIGNSMELDSLQTSTSCVGERILSLRSLLKRYNSIAYVGSTVTTTFSFLPFSIPVSIVDSSNILTVSEFSFADVFSSISLPFALSRGSMRYKFIRSVASDQEVITARSLPWSLAESSLQGSQNFAYVTPSFQIGGLGNGSNNTLQYTHITGGLELEFTYYHRTWCHPVADAMNNVNAIGSVVYLQTTSAPRQYCIVECGNTSSSYRILRAGGEDLSLGLFVSIPGYSSWSSHNS